ncbi:hypothetical protein G9A89_014735 [Geosiphon pyriformis]|nr:hypothetical protein G9A89_014735 [Geosiphon pyriformis]
MVITLKNSNHDYQHHQNFDYHYLNQILEPQQNQNDLNSDTINQHLFSVIVINQPLIEPIFQQPIIPIAYVPIAKIEKFTGKKNDTQVWLNNNTADLWYQNLANKSQNFNVFKLEFLRYFNNNNSINHLANTFTIIKQGDAKVVTTYLELCSLFSADLYTAVIHARDFKTAELKTNHTQAINLVINKSSNLDSKVKQFIMSIVINKSAVVAKKHMPATTVNNLSLLITPKNIGSNNQKANQKPLTNNISSATITEDKSLTAIFFFKLKESTMSLFSKAALNTKLITAIYTDTKVDDHPIKLILDSRLADSIIT